MPTLEPWQSALVDELRVARLATIGPSGQPHLVPVCYAFSEGRIFIPVDEKPKSSTNLARIRNIESDPRVSLLFDHYDDDWTQLAWVRVDGEAEVLARGDSAALALVALRKRYRQYGAMDLESAPLIAIVPANVAAWRWPR